jgi:hypothetical protein
MVANGLDFDDMKLELAIIHQPLPSIIVRPSNTDWKAVNTANDSRREVVRLAIRYVVAVVPRVV